MNRKLSKEEHALRILKGDKLEYVCDQCFYLGSVDEFRKHAADMIDSRCPNGCSNAIVYHKNHLLNWIGKDAIDQKYSKKCEDIAHKAGLI